MVERQIRRRGIETATVLAASAPSRARHSCRKRCAS
jgi:hypothetical protein